MFFRLKNKVRFAFFEMIGLILSLSAFSQPIITGPTCVVPGTVYHYRIAGPWTAASTMQVCITGGYIKDMDSSQKTCTLQGGAPLGSVLIVWNQPGNSSLTLSSAIGNSSLKVSVVSPLIPGTIASSSKHQTIANNSIPLVIICSADSGGACSPSYILQWQQSQNMLAWIDIKNAVGENLVVPTTILQPTYYRRRVTEKSSGTIGYSDAAWVDVLAPTPAASQSATNSSITPP